MRGLMGKLLYGLCLTANCFFEVREGIEGMACIESFVVLSMTASYRPVMSWSVGFDELVLDANFLSTRKKGHRLRSCAVGICVNRIAVLYIFTALCRVLRIIVNPTHRFPRFTSGVLAIYPGD